MGKTKRGTSNTPQTASFSELASRIKSLVIELRPYIVMMIPFLVEKGRFLNNFVQTKVAPYYTNESGRLVWNILLIFFGGQFALTIMAIQAFNMVGSEKIKSSLSELHVSYMESMAKLQQDPEARSVLVNHKSHKEKTIIGFDDILLSFSDSITAQTSEQREKSTKFLSLCMRCVDPRKVYEASTGIMLGMLVVIATLKSRIAKCVSVGANVGKHIAQFAKLRIEKPLYEMYPYHKDWVDVGLQTGSSLVGILISIILARVVNSFSSAVMGAEGIADMTLKYAHRKGKLLSIRHNDTMVQSIVAVIVFVGVMSQIKMKFAIPWFLKLPMIPLVLAESILTLVSVS